MTQRNTTCPDCDGTEVTHLEITEEDYSPTFTIDMWVRQANDGDSATFRNVCWNCGWSEERTVTVE